MKREAALKILDDVRAGYDKIAIDFSRTRKSVWEEFEFLSDYAKTGDKVLDLGCGNGRLVDSFKGRAIDYVGLDNSEKLIEIAKQRNPSQSFRVFDGLTTPFKDNFFDKIFCIAVLHHIPGVSLRQEFLREAGRVLAPGGQLTLTTWHIWNRLSFWRLLFKFTLKKLTGKSELDFFDVMEPWGDKTERYFRNFRKRELRKLVAQSGLRIERFEVLVRKGWNKNLVIVAKKI